MGRSRSGREVELEAALARLLESWPDNPVREAREGPQMEIAAKSGLTQTHLSDLENRRRELTEDVARRLGPALGMTGETLMAAEIVSGLKAMARENPGELDAHLLVELVGYLDRMMVEDEFSDRLLTTLLELAEERINAYRERGEAASLKSRSTEGRRDPFGRRRRKPFGPGDLR